MENQTPQEALQALLDSLPDTGEVWTQDELKMSTPFSDLETWTRIIQGQLRSGRSFLRGPPGLWEKLAAQHASITGQETVSPPSTPTTKTD